MPVFSFQIVDRNGRQGADTEGQARAWRLGSSLCGVHVAGEAVAGLVRNIVFAYARCNALFTSNMRTGRSLMLSLQSCPASSQAASAAAIRLKKLQIRDRYVRMSIPGRDMPSGAKASGAKHTSPSPSRRGGLNSRAARGRGGGSARGASYSFRGSRDDSEGFHRKRQRTQSFEGARAGKKSKEVKSEIVKSIGKVEVKSKMVKAKLKTPR